MSDQEQRAHRRKTGMVWALAASIILLIGLTATSIIVLSRQPSPDLRCPPDRPVGRTASSTRRM